MNKLPEISSEFIEPYLTKVMGGMFESIGLGLLPPKDAKQMLRGIDWFISQTCGVHARIAMSNTLCKFIDLTDKQLIEICKRVVKETTFE